MTTLRRFTIILFKILSIGKSQILSKRLGSLAKYLFLETDDVGTLIYK